MAKIYYDTECFNDFFLASFLFEDGEFVDFAFHKKVDANEKRMFKAFWQMHDNAGDTFIGFNSIGYDNPIIVKFLKTKNITLQELKQYSDEIISHSDDEDYKSPREFTKDFADIFLILKKNKNDFPGLKATACAMNYANLKESEISFSKESLTDEDVASTILYCHNDVALTKEIFESDDIQGKYSARLGLIERFGFSKRDALTRTPSSAAGLAIRAMCLEGAKEGDVFPPAELRFTGKDIITDKLSFQTEECKQIVEEIKTWERDFSVDSQLSPNITMRMGANEISIGVGGIHTKKSGDNTNFTFIGDKETYILDADVDSYYPNILINLDLGPEGVKEKFTKAVAEVLRMKREATNKAERQAAKLIINSLTGYMKNKFAGVIYAPKANEAMTINGQLMLLELCESLHLQGFHITQVNTDGISVLMTNARRTEFDETLHAWEKKWGFTMKFTEYTHLVQSGVNEYLAVKRDGGIKTTGGLFNLYESPTGVDRYPIVSKCVVAYLLYGKPITETVRSGSSYDYVRAVKRPGGWKLTGDAKGVMHNRGINRFYLTNDNNLLGGISNTESRRESKIETGVAFANDISDLDRNAIAYERYVALAEETIADFDGRAMSSYSDERYIVRGDTTDKELIPLEGGSVVRKLLVEAGLATKRGRTLKHCVDPDCNPRNGSSRCEIYDEGTTAEHTFCHQCRSYLTADKLANILGAPTEQLTLAAEPIKREAPAHDSTDLPECVWTGSVGVIADAMHERSWRVLAGALTARHALIGRKIDGDYFAGTKIHGNLYTIFTGASGTGKSVAMNVSQRALGKDFNIITSIESGQALFQAITESHEEITGQKVNAKGKPENITKNVYTAVPTLFAFEEFMATLKKAKADFSTIDQELCTLFQAGPVYKMCSRAIAKEDGVPTRSVENPDVSLLATMTTKQFIEHFNETRQTNGLLNRMLVLPETPFARKMTEEGERPDWGMLAHAFDSLRTRTEKVDGFVVREDYFDAGAWEIYKTAFSEWFAKDDPTQDELTPYSRYQLLWFILALGYAYDAGRYDHIAEADACAASAVIGASRLALGRLLAIGADQIEMPAYMTANGRVDDDLEKYILANPGKTKREIVRAKQTKKMPTDIWEGSLQRLLSSRRAVTRISAENVQRSEYFIQ